MFELGLKKAENRGTRFDAGAVEKALGDVVPTWVHVEQFFCDLPLADLDCHCERDALMQSTVWKRALAGCLLGLKRWQPASELGSKLVFSPHDPACSCLSSVALSVSLWETAPHLYAFSGWTSVSHLAGGTSASYLRAVFRRSEQHPRQQPSREHADSRSACPRRGLRLCLSNGVSGDADGAPNVSRDLPHRLTRHGASRALFDVFAFSCHIA